METRAQTGTGQEHQVNPGFGASAGQSLENRQPNKASDVLKAANTARGHALGPPNQSDGVGPIRFPPWYDLHTLSNFAGSLPQPKHAGPARRTPLKCFQ